MINAARKVQQLNWQGGVDIVQQTLVHSAEDLIVLYEQFLNEGFEGLIARSIDGPYKSNRSTWKQGWMLKYKPLADAEGKVIGFTELMRNKNEKLVDELGFAKRSSHKDGMVPGGTMGNIILMTKEWGKIHVGVGFTAEQRQTIWDNHGIFLDKQVTFKYMPYGMKDKPRHPIFKAFRED
jgi:DNA ligase-1